MAAGRAYVNIDSRGLRKTGTAAPAMPGGFQYHPTSAKPPIIRAGRGQQGAMQQRDGAIVTRSLVREFGEVKAVNGVDLTVEPGEIYGFLGPNGAGKTTVIRMLITLLAPTRGEIFVAGFNAVSEPAQVRRRIGAALQEAALDAKQTGRELLVLQGRLYGLAPAANQRPHRRPFRPHRHRPRPWTGSSAPIPAG